MELPVLLDAMVLDTNVMAIPMQNVVNIPKSK